MKLKLRQVNTSPFTVSIGPKDYFHGQQLYLQKVPNPLTNNLYRCCCFYCYFNLDKYSIFDIELK